MIDDIFDFDESPYDEDAIVHGPLHVPMIDMMEKLGIAIINSGDAITMVFSNRKAMYKFGEDLQWHAECGKDRISLAPEGTPSDNVAVAKDIARDLF
jgi:hypothetical protein